MKEENLNWLPQLKNAIPVYGYGNRLSMYLISLEAWRRGVNVIFFTEANSENKVLIRYALEKNGNKFVFNSSQGEKLSEKAYNICKNKDETKSYLKKCGLPVPEGMKFETTSKVETILRYAEKIGFPVVVKPTNEKGGRGVFSNITTKNELKETIIFLKNEMGIRDIIVEKYISGTEYRILLINGDIVAAVNRIPANVIGDGVNTIEQLINLKNKSKKQNPNLSKKVIKIDREVLKTLEQSGYKLDSIPSDGERIFVRQNSNVSTGGDAIDVTDELSEEVKKIAIKASKAIPGLDVCGLDMIVNNNKNKGTIIELNTKPMLGLHVFPVAGEPRDVVSPIIDYYFPETIGKPKTNLYFNFDNVVSVLDNVTVKEIKLQPPETLVELVSKRYSLHGQSINQQYCLSIKRKAIKQGLHGFINLVEKNKAKLMLSGRDIKVIEVFEENFLYNHSIDIVENGVFNEPIKIGFEMEGRSNKEILKDLRKERKERVFLQRKLNQEAEKKEYLKQLDMENNEKIKLLTREISNLKKENKLIEAQKQEVSNQLNIYKNKYSSIINSKTWRFTLPVRKFFKKISGN